MCQEGEGSALISRRIKISCKGREKILFSLSSILIKLDKTWQVQQVSPRITIMLSLSITADDIDLAPIDTFNIWGSMEYRECSSRYKLGLGLKDYQLRTNIQSRDVCNFAVWTGIHLVEIWKILRQVLERKPWLIRIYSWFNGCCEGMLFNRRG